MVSMQAVNEFLAQRRLAVVGVSDAKGSFAKTVYRTYVRLTTQHEFEEIRRNFRYFSDSSSIQ